MDCKKIREQMPDVAAGMAAAAPEMTAHIDACADCAREMEELRKTMALLDEWQAPEPSPYFDVRLEARLREEAAKPARTWRWFVRPALAATFAVLMVASITFFRGDGGPGHVVPPKGPDTVVAVVAEPAPGTAVGDLQSLDKNHELLSDFDVLDDLQVKQDATANP